MIQNLQDTYTLANGVKMPGFGFGVWQTPQNVTAKVVKAALKAGYRNIDTAAAYGNEKEVGEGIRLAMAEYGIKREEIFVSTKLWNDHRGYELAKEAIETSLANLDIGYIDCYMLHWPAVAKWHDDWREINADTWRACEEYYDKGLIKSLGVANYLAHHVEALMGDVRIAPMVNQIEYHPGFGQIESTKFCQEHGIVVQAWSPLGTGDVLKNAELTRIAEKYGKSTAQICLRWLIQKDIVPLPKSTHEARIIANTEVFDFMISDEDMKAIDAIPYCGGMRFDPESAKS
ncbi:MAG: aldo/keto reductase [Eubacteriales bacterium]|nr:aldo/keto reductase [Eubacteriales bacterium]